MEERPNFSGVSGKREERYCLDFPLNIRDRVFSAQEVHLVLLQHMPCDMPFTIFSGDPVHPTGSGTYIKRNAPGAFEVRAEQGACRGLMAWLFPGTAIHQTAPSSRAFAHS